MVVFIFARGVEQAEVMVVFIFAYLSYVTADLVGWSAIISLTGESLPVVGSRSEPTF